MKKLTLILSAVYAAAQMVVMADIVVPGADGSDCDLVITQNTVIDLSLATTAAWNASYNVLAAADPNRVATDYIGKGVYDSVKWAVVFRYTDVSIAAGATVTFKNHPSRAPVVWLVSGNVDIAGTVSLNGNSWLTAPLQSQPGPGGFRGGMGGYTANTPTAVVYRGGSGFGPGGGDGDEAVGFGGSHATNSQTGVSARPIVYGNPSLLPLCGGSGGGGEPTFGTNEGGGGGGGAILVASQKQIQIGGQLTAVGGNGHSNVGGSLRYTGGGSGGGLRLVCSSLTGSGSINALGAVGSQPGGQGRIRLERVGNVNALAVTPAASTSLLSEGATALIWPPDTAPTAKLISFGGVPTPVDPRAEFSGSAGPDLVVGSVPTSPAVIETTNLPQAGSQVQVRITPQHNTEYSVVNAVYDSQISANPLVLRWVATVPVTNGYSAIQVRIVAP